VLYTTDCFLFFAHGGAKCGEREALGPLAVADSFATDAGANAHWLAVDRRGRVYVAEVGASRLHRYVQQEE
jgi:hypothetical protein